MFKKPTYEELEQEIRSLHKELGKKESTFCEIQKLASIGNWEWNIEKQILIWSDEVYRIFGFEPVSFKPTIEAFEATIHPDDIKSFLNQREIMLSERKKSCIDHRIVRPDGSIRYVQECTQQIFNHQNEVCRVIGTVQDITERRQAEEILRESRDLLTNLACLVPGVIYQYRLNPDGSSAFPWSSPGMNDIYEVTPEEVKEDATPVFGRLHPEDLEMVSNAILESARTLNTFYCEFRVILPRQGLRWRWSQALPERTEDGGTLWHGIISDITERKKVAAALQASEKKLKQWNKELEKRIKERTSSLEDLNTALRVLLKKREEDKNQIGANIYANFKSLIQPMLNQLKNSLTTNIQEDILDILESSIKEMAIPFSKKLADPIVGLTPTEIQVAALVKDGKTNKEIAQILNKSIRAITSHRNNIRLKLGLKNKKTNLRSYLLSHH